MPDDTIESWINRAYSRCLEIGMTEDEAAEFTYLLEQESERRLVKHKAKFQRLVNLFETLAWMDANKKMQDGLVCAS